MKITKEQIEALKRAIKTHKANHVLGNVDGNRSKDDDEERIYM